MLTERYIRLRETYLLYHALRVRKTAAPGMVAETITLGTLVVLAFQAFFFSVVQFLSMRWMRHVWRKWRRRS
jgi:hypothetical protein